jgi:hypothetical protein
MDDDDLVSRSVVEGVRADGDGEQRRELSRPHECPGRVAREKEDGTIARALAGVGEARDEVWLAVRVDVAGRQPGDLEPCPRLEPGDADVERRDPARDERHISSRA